MEQNRAKIKITSNIQNRTIPMWYDQTIAALQRTHLSIREIQDATGLSRRFLYYLLSGSYTKDPGIGRMQRLHDFLTEQEQQAA